MRFVPAIVSMPEPKWDGERKRSNWFAKRARQLRTLPCVDDKKLTGKYDVAHPRVVHSAASPASPPQFAARKKPRRVSRIAGASSFSGRDSLLICINDGM